MKRLLRLIFLILLLSMLTGCGVIEVEIINISQKCAEDIFFYREAYAVKEMSKDIVDEPSDILGQEEVQAPIDISTIDIYEYTTGEKEYFADALFIGDSRTAGLQMFGTLDNADYFASPGLNLYTLYAAKVEYGEEKLRLEELLEKKNYGKIYVMFGINELGYKYETTIEKYNALITMLQEKEPQAIIYVCANLHVTKQRDEKDKIHNNEAINKINAQIAALEDKRNIFYLDVNEMFDDEEGNLNTEYASDDSHVKAAYYVEWCEWLKQHTIYKPMQ